MEQGRFIKDTGIYLKKRTGIYLKLSPILEILSTVAQKSVNFNFCSEWKFTWFLFHQSSKDLQKFVRIFRY